ncbi:ferric reductase-like transmembrane domain-containing protein [Neobacillus sp. OS1-2]|uniref:ferric reductase-like transmembrane domain-containing protein n=1 Tax=Neobacillus sp. OS1-2 TaxID=3070680 RepID=UPI0027DEEF73|nr:ferric reductase-like transmembrane domain-containing protein [Neobacillus sp. OS1-2]WML40064.1 ferric reductase-like transmembrane domain-containing protein [Neobacillus sp. OS1-2]
MSDFFSVWTLIRVSGFLAFYFMTLSLAIGLFSSFSIMKKKKARFLSYHQTSGWYGLLTILFHILLIWQDQYVPYSLRELFVPFMAKNEPLFSGLGTLSFYLFLIVIGSSDFFIKKMGVKKWKKIHFAVIPAWIFMLVHGLAIGTDSSEPWALLIYLLSSSFILVLLFMRIVESIMLHQPIGRNNTHK